MMMNCKKIYLQPADMVMNAIHDVGGLQNGKMTLCDSPRGLVGYIVTIRGENIEYRFSVMDIGSRCSRVTIGLIGEKSDAQRLIDSEFALLDYALLDKAKIDLAEIEDWDRKIEDERKKRKGNRRNAI